METLQHWENDALLVDDLLDFSCGDIGEGEGDDCVVTCIRAKETESSCLESCAASTGRASAGSSDGGDCLYLPAEEVAELEWLSRFVEESYKGVDNSLPLVTSDEWFSTGARKEGCLRTTGADGKRPTSWLRMGASSQILDVGSSPLIETPACFPLQHCKRGEWDKRSRSKRSSRSGGRVWSLQRVMRPNEDDNDDDNDQEASSLDYEPYPDPVSPKFQCKKTKKASDCNTMQEGRRCSHCQVQKTPQWRAGPLGPKTLCNACGVRYKSGRLLPEYRPAASPTFVSELHSNSHKKVLEMRTFKACVEQELDHKKMRTFKACVEQELDQDEFSSCSQESSQESITSLRV